MKRRKMTRLIINCLMIVLFLLLMAYELIGKSIHEWIGICLFLLVLIHHLMNRMWFWSIAKGKYTPYRILQTLVVLASAICILGSITSGIMISRTVFSSLPIHGGHSFARILHLLSAYWGFLIASLHIGLHGNQFAMRMKKVAWARTRLCRFGLLFAAGLLAVYGVYAFLHRQIGSYLLLQNVFVFFDFKEPIIWFLLDYFAVMWLFAVLGYLLSLIFRKTYHAAGTKQKKEGRETCPEKNG